MQFHRCSLMLGYERPTNALPRLIFADHEHDARGDHLGDADDDLLHLRREPGHGLDEIGLHPAHGAIGDRREDHADEHERAADEQPEHVAG